MAPSSPLPTLRRVPEVGAYEEESPMPKDYNSVNIKMPKQFTLKLWKLGQPVKSELGFNTTKAPTMKVSSKQLKVRETASRQSCCSTTSTNYSSDGDKAAASVCVPRIRRIQLRNYRSSVVVSQEEEGTILRPHMANAEILKVTTSRPSLKIKLPSMEELKEQDPTAPRGFDYSHEALVQCQDIISEVDMKVNQIA